MSQVTIERELLERAIATAQAYVDLVHKQHQGLAMDEPTYQTFSTARDNTIPDLRAALQAAPAQAVERKYISHVHTVADLINNLSLMDQTLPIYGAQWIDHADKRRCIAVSPIVSRERVKDSRWIGEGTELNAAVIWTRAEQPVNQVLVDALKEAKRWHQGDKWREGDTNAKRAAWESHLAVLEAAITEGRKALAEQAPSTAGERAEWLIEVKSLGPSWICSVSREHGFTRDANKAIQFPTKESAEAVLAHLWKAGRNGTVFGLDSSCYSVTEHIFLGATPPSHDAGKLVESLDSIRRYGLDTLSGRTDGPDDRDWQRQAVNEMTKRATAALLSAPAPSTAGEPTHQGGNYEQQVRSEMDAMGGQQPIESAGSGGNSNPAVLVSNIEALLALDTAGALVPHGIGGHARSLLKSAAALLQSPALPDHIPDAGKMVAAMPAVELTDQSNLATIAGLEASTGHLSAMVDELRALLGRALDNFTTLHNAAKPDEDGPDIDAIIPGGVFARFVDEDAAIRYALNQTCHAEAVAAARSQPAQVPLTGAELETCRQWFNSVQDTNGGYLTPDDYVLAEKLYGILKIRCQSSITSVTAALQKGQQ